MAAIDEIKIRTLKPKAIGDDFLGASWNKINRHFHMSTISTPNDGTDLP
jgi:hypothetical protein